MLVGMCALCGIHVETDSHVIAKRGAAGVFDAPGARVRAVLLAKKYSSRIPVARNCRAGSEIVRNRAEVGALHAAKILLRERVDVVRRDGAARSSSRAKRREHGLAARTRHAFLRRRRIQREYLEGCRKMTSRAEIEDTNSHPGIGTVKAAIYILVHAGRSRRICAKYNIMRR